MYERWKVEPEHRKYYSTAQKVPKDEGLFSKGETSVLYSSKKWFVFINFNLSTTRNDGKFTFPTLNEDPILRRRTHRIFRGHNQVNG